MIVSKVRLVVKRLDNGKHVSKMKTPFHLMLTEHMIRNGMSAGIYSLLAPKNIRELNELEKAKLTHVVESVQTRETDMTHPSDLFNDTGFPVAIAEWWIDTNKHPKVPFIGRLCKELAREQSLIVDGSIKRDLKLEAIFRKFQDHLLFRKRKQTWWEDRFAEQRKRYKKPRVKLLKKSTINTLTSC